MTKIYRNINFIQLRADLLCHCHNSKFKSDVVSEVMTNALDKTETRIAECEYDHVKPGQDRTDKLQTKAVEGK